MLTAAEFDELMNDDSKSISTDIGWSEDEDHSPTVEFRVEVQSDPGYPLFIRGSYNQLAKAMAFALIHRGVGRIYCLCIGKDHHNPSCQFVGEKHKHTWTEQSKDKEAYAPADITASSTEVSLAWKQFCAEAKIQHTGAFREPPAVQEDLFG